MAGSLPPLASQVNTGEVHLRITDTAGLGLSASVTLSSDENRYRRQFATDDQGSLDIRPLPYGVYLIRAEHQGFAPLLKMIEVRSASTVEQQFSLGVVPVSTVVQVSDAATLIDPASPLSVTRIGEQQIRDRLASLPGRSIQDLVDSQPGWLYEGNAVLHPRGAEYQTQFVIDGVPLTDNRSPSFGPAIEADNLDSISIYTAGIPAEYGRKLGGVVELNTHRDIRSGPHGQVDLGGGSYDTSQGYAEFQEVWGKNTAGVTASGSRTAHYLNPVVPQNFTNRGTTGDLAARFSRDLGSSDTLDLSVRHELSRFEIPNELLQQQAGQLQNGGNFETIGMARYQHIFSPEALGTLAIMSRDNASDLTSNQSSTPIYAVQHNRFRESYVKGTYSRHHSQQEFKAGFESDTTFLHEAFSYDLTDPTQFDPSTAPHLAFTGHRVALEQSAFFEDQVRLGNWSVSAGVRYDHYQLLRNQHAISPRVAVGRFVPKLNIVLHASYDRVFQTPSFENILISSSPTGETLNSNFLHLPVQPSRGNYYEGGLTRGFFDHIIVTGNVYRRDVSNYADDNQLLNTGISYPISFRKAVVYGAEGKIELIRFGPLSGYTSYSYLVDQAWFPVTGGLFLGGDVSAFSQTDGHFPGSQDQRNTLGTRFRYQLVPRVWLASGLRYGSGLPFAYQGTQADALSQYGPGVTDRLNFDRGRVNSSLAISASLGADLFQRKERTISLQVDGDDLNNRLNVLNFGGLFSGNAIAPKRSFNVRLNTSF